MAWNFSMWKANTVPVSLQDTFYMQNRWTVLNTLYREIFIRDLMAYTRDPRRKTSQRQLFYLRDSPQIFLWNTKKGRAPAFYRFAAYSFLLCSQGNVGCPWIDLNSCSSRISRVLPQHRAFRTGTGQLGAELSLIEELPSAFSDVSQSPSPHPSRWQ